MELSIGAGVPNSSIAVLLMRFAVVSSTPFFFSIFVFWLPQQNLPLKQTLIEPKENKIHAYKKKR